MKFPTQKICAGVITLAACCRAEMPPPNILFIVCDDLNDTIEGMGGHPQAHTPNIARLMQRGVRFVNAQANCPLCSPSRASLWSGLAPQTTDFYGYHQDNIAWRENPMLKNTVTLFEHASHNGYRVFATGKIHHNGNEDWSVFRNSDGTDGFRIKPDWGPYPWDGVSSKGWNDRGLVHPSLPAEWQTGDARFDFPSSFGPVVDISSAYGGKGRWVLEDRMPFEVRSPYDLDPLPDERCAAFAAGILQSRQDQPFLLAVGFNRPHVPLYVPQKYFDMFPIESVQLSPGIGGNPAEVPDCFKIAPGIKRYRKFMDAGGIELFRRWTQAYLASVAFVDEQIGVLLDALEAGPHLSNTIVILTSDNGYHMGEKEINSKNTVWERSMRVPLVIAGPGIVTGRECTHPVSLVDLYPTCVDYGQLPADPNRTTNGKPLDGHSLRPFLENPDTKEWNGAEFALSCASSAVPLDPDKAGHIEDQHWSVRTERYRYVRGQDKTELLYNYQNDPREWVNLANHPEYQLLLKTFRIDLEKALQESVRSKEKK